jgi:peptidoglycan/xylan/chitin deacetylase (PgdA/CDA1 family)
MTVRETLAGLRAVGLSWRTRLSASQAGVALVYHRVGGDAGGDPSREILPVLPAKAFARQLRHIRRHYRVVRASELVEAVRRRRRGERFPACITFDDDLAGHLREALPVLQRERVSATFFLGGASLAGPHSFWWQDLQLAVDSRTIAPDAVPHVAAAELRPALERRPKAIFRVAATIQRLAPTERDEVASALRTAAGSAAPDDGLRAADVRALIAAGCDVGFHTLRHEALPRLDDGQLERALRDGREGLEAVAARRLDAISYPHGKADERVAEAARAAGFTLGFTTGRGAVTADTDPLLVPRIPPALSTGKTALRLARAVASSASR